MCKNRKRKKRNKKISKEKKKRKILGDFPEFLRLFYLKIFHFFEITFLKTRKQENVFYLILLKVKNIFKLIYVIKNKYLKKMLLNEINLENLFIVQFYNNVKLFHLENNKVLRIEMICTR